MHADYRKMVQMNCLQGRNTDEDVENGCVDTVEGKWWGGSGDGG